MYRVKLTPTAAEMFNSLHPEIRKQIKAILKELPWAAQGFYLVLPTTNHESHIGFTETFI